MRTLMIAPQPFFQPRGTPFSVLHRLKALSSLGYKIDLVTYHLGEDVAIDGVKIYRIPRLPMIKKIAVGPSKLKILLDIFVIKKAIALLRKWNYDLIHSHEEAGFFATLLARRYHTLHLYDMHSSLPQQLSNFKFTRAKALIHLFERLEAATIHHADAIITICPELYNYVQKKFPGKYNVLIENVADNSLVFSTNTKNKSIQVKSNGEMAILYTGTFEPYQGLDLLIEAGSRVINQFKNVKFILVGGKPEQIEIYSKKVKSMRLEPWFIFTGSVPPQDIPDYISQCDVLVSPRVEGTNTPLKIYSYLRSGKPIVATNHITHTQVLNDDVSVLAGCNSEEFAGAIVRVLKDSALRKKIVENARRLAEEKYSYETYLNKTKQVYRFLEQELIKRGRN